MGQDQSSRAFFDSSGTTERRWLPCLRSAWGFQAVARARNSNALVQQPSTSATDHTDDYILLYKIHLFVAYITVPTNSWFPSPLNGLFLFSKRAVHADLNDTTCPRKKRPQLLDIMQQLRLDIFPPTFPYNSAMTFWQPPLAPRYIVTNSEILIVEKNSGLAPLRKMFLWCRSQERFYVSYIIWKAVILSREVIGTFFLGDYNPFCEGGVCTLYNTEPQVEGFGPFSRLFISFHA